MPLVVADRVKETTTTTGTGTLTLAGAVTGFQAFSVIGSGNTTYYAISSSSSEWEVGIGTYNSVGPALTRDTILASSNSGSAVNLSAGVKEVYVVYPAGRAVFVDGTSVVVPNNGVLAIANGGTGSNTATFSGANISSLNASNISTGILANARTTASSSNGANTIVSRDGSGNFSANVITANGSSITAINASNISTGTLAVGRGGTGAATLTAEAVIVGNGTSAVKFVSPGTSGNVLTSNGTAWTSVTPSAPVTPFSENLDVVSTNYTIASGRNALSVGPMTVNNGVSVTVSSGQRWVVI